MKVTISKKDYFINDDEFTLFKNNEFCNLKIYNNLSILDRLVNFINEIIHSSNIENKYLYVVKSTHGGYLPINCSKNYKHIYLSDTNENHKNNIETNINNFNIKNISFEPIEFNSDNENIEKIMFIDSNDENRDIINNYCPEILITKHNFEDMLNNYFEHKYKLKNTEYYVYLESSNNFNDYFKNYIENNILVWDNLINFCLMIKNGGDQLEQMLTENLPIIDRYTILDTGSTDNTVEIIKKVLANKIGNLYEEEFINFKDSRNRLLELAGNSCKFNLMVDDTYVAKGDLRKFLNIVRCDQLSDSFVIDIKSDDILYGSNRITRSEKNLKYMYKVHEVIQENNNYSIHIPNKYCFFEDKKNDYMMTRTKDRLESDLKILFKEIENNKHDTRSYYYIAQTYKLMGNYEEAYKYYLKRTKFQSSGYREEYVDSIFEAAKLANFNLNKSWILCKSLYEKCYHSDTKRPESLYFIGINYYLLGDNKTAYGYLKDAFELGIPIHTQYNLKPTLYLHFVPKFLTRVCYELKDYELGYIASKFFIDNNNSNSDDINEVISWNNIFIKLLMFKGEKVIKNTFNKPVVIFVSDGGYGPWTGSDIINKSVGGSETYIIEMAKYIKQQNMFKTIVFCNTPNKKDELFMDTLYTHIDNYYEFINTTEVHTCIISRYSEYLPVAIDGFVENIYMVIHDLTTSGNVIPMHNKLKNVFCMSEWHHSYFTNMFPSLKNVTIPFYNGTSFKNNKRVNKIPFKFIYSSYPNRGLLHLLEMWPEIYKKQSKATLHIYCDLTKQWVNSIEHNQIDKINELIELHTDKGIVCHNRVSKQELEHAWQTTDIWFYPCTFQETFCITALEAAITKTFVITNDLAGLQNTVGDRGIVIKGDPSTNEWKKQALEQLFLYLDGKNNMKDFMINKNYEWAKNLTWENRANDLLNNYILKNNIEHAELYNWNDNHNDIDTMTKIAHYIKDNFDTFEKNIKYSILDIGSHTCLSLINLVKLFNGTNKSVGIAIDDKYNDLNIIKSFNNNIKNDPVKNQITYLNMNVTKSLIYLNNITSIFHLIFISKVDNVNELYLNLNLSWNILTIKGVLGINYPSENIDNKHYTDTINFFINKYKCNVIHNKSMIFLEKLNQI